MISAADLARLAAGDFAERTRRYGFLVTLGFTVWAATIFVPPLDAGYTTVNIHGHRGAYSSAWVGAQVALLLNLFLGLFGFYLIKSAVDRDRTSGVGELLAATPLSRAGYTLSKALSNFAVLASMVAVVALCSIVLQWVRAEDPRIEPVALLMPYLLVTLPLMALVAAVAVLFEVLPLLRGGIGNVAWFILWSATGVMGMEGRKPDVSYGDPVGIGSILPSMVRAVREAFPHEQITGERISMGIQIGGNQGRPLVPFEFEGIEWAPELIGWRIFWMGMAVVIGAAAALPFDRFANEGSWAGALVRRRPKGATVAASEAVVGAPLPAFAPFDPWRLDSAPPSRRFDLPTLVRAEMVVALKGFPRAWFLVALTLSILALALPLQGVKTYFAPLLFIWPMLLWSALGAREARHGTTELFFSAPRPLTRQLSATWLAGVTIAACVIGTYALRLALAGDGAGAVTCLVGVAFVPALALACGVMTGSGRLFEVLYFFLWYGAALNHVPFLDFTGAMAAQTGLAVAAAYSVATAALLAVAWVTRRAHLAR